MQGETPAAMEMEATMGITCTEGNAVGVVAVFGQYLHQKITLKSKIFNKIKKKKHIQLYIMMYRSLHGSK